MNTLAQRVCHTIVAFGCAAAFVATPSIHAQGVRWVATGPLNVPRFAHAATLLADGSVLVVGGSNEPNGGNALASAERYDPATGSWRVVASPAVPRGLVTATLLLDGKVLVVGGSERPEIYDPVADTWSMTTGTAVPHFSHTATRLANGKVLVVGGTGDFSVPSVPFTAELYDPATGQWANAGNPRWARVGHTATLLVNGTVLVAGGISNDYPDGGSPDPQKAEIYDPATNSWREVGTPLRTAEHTATLLATGKVLIAGHTFPDWTAQLFDPASETWRYVGSLNAARLGHTATLLTSGKVLLVGSGALVGPGVSTAVETYDPGTERFTSTSPLGVGRHSHTATLLANGNVLVAGGMGHAGEGFPVRGTAELYVLPFEIGAGLSGIWYDPAQSGHGLFIEVLRDNRLLAGWFAFNPGGTAQALFVGVGTYSGDTATITSVDMPTGGRWIPNFDPSSLVHNEWGTLTFRFTDCDHGTVSFNSPSFGVGTMSLTRLTQPLGLSCP